IWGLGDGPYRHEVAKAQRAVAQFGLLRDPNCFIEAVPDLALASDELYRLTRHRYAHPSSQREVLVQGGQWTVRPLVKVIAELVEERNAMQKKEKSKSVYSSPKTINAVCNALLEVIADIGPAAEEARDEIKALCDDPILTSYANVAMSQI